jgi:hypothetical protein
MEDTMQVAPASRSRPSVVMVLFRDTARFFEMPAGATLGELADHLAAICERYGGKPVAVDVRVVC